MARTDRPPSMSVATCTGLGGCGYVLPPAKSWTEFTVAEHRWVHLTAMSRRRARAGSSDTRADLAELIEAAEAYIAGLVARDVERRRTIADLHDRVNDLEFAVDDGCLTINGLRDELADARRSHPCQ